MGGATKQMGVIHDQTNPTRKDDRQRPVPPDPALPSSLTGKEESTQTYQDNKGSSRDKEYGVHYNDQKFQNEETQKINGYGPFGRPLSETMLYKSSPAGAPGRGTLIHAFTEMCSRSRSLQQVLLCHAGPQ